VSREELTERIAELLSARSGVVAREIARTLSAPKSDVNSVLYDSPRFVFEQGEGAAPLWHLADAAPTNADASTRYVARADASGESHGESAATRSVTTTDVETYTVVSSFDPDGEADATEVLFNEDDISPEVVARFTKSATGERPAPAVVERTDDNPFALYDWQREALRGWRLSDYRGIVEAVTGAGKTRIAISAIADHLAEDGKVLVLVPTVVLLHQWRENLESAIPGLRVGLVGDGWDDQHDRFDVLVAVLASARRRNFPLGGATGLLVADEVHRAGAEYSQRALDVAFTKRLGLSATYERLDNAHETALLPYFGRVVFRYGYAEGIRDGVISSVRVAFVGVAFSEEEALRYQQLILQLKAARRTLLRDWGVRPGPFSAFLDDVIRLTHQGGVKGGMAAQRWLKLWGQKKDMLAETPAKQAAIRHLSGALTDADRSLIFTQSIESANTIAETVAECGLAVATHHSKVPAPERQRIMRDFADGTTTVLSSVQTLEEGVDVPDADLAVIVAASKQRRQMVQRMGRIMRRKTDGRDARFVIMFVRATDEDPRFGAHDTFVDELLEVARESAIFVGDDDHELREFVRPDRRA
jgi:superfamily II DNA or RNA helicase